MSKGPNERSLAGTRGTMHDDDATTIYGRLDVTKALDLLMNGVGVVRRNIFPVEQLDLTRVLIVIVARRTPESNSPQEGLFIENVFSLFLEELLREFVTILLTYVSGIRPDMEVSSVLRRRVNDNDSIVSFEHEVTIVSDFIRATVLAAISREEKNIIASQIVVEPPCFKLVSLTGERQTSDIATLIKLRVDLKILRIYNVDRIRLVIKPRANSLSYSCGTIHL
jgi:hypothetical protein